MSSSGYSGTPLAKKLGLKPGLQVCLINEPTNYWDFFSEIPDELQILNAPQEPVDMIHYFAQERFDLEHTLLGLKELIKPNGMIWVSWPKKASKVPTDVTEDVIRNFALEIGLVDIKVCAVNDIWSGLKLVIPVKLRSKKLG